MLCIIKLKASWWIKNQINLHNARITDKGPLSSVCDPCYSLLVPRDRQVRRLTNRHYQHSTKCQHNGSEHLIKPLRRTENQNLSLFKRERTKDTNNTENARIKKIYFSQKKYAKACFMYLYHIEKKNVSLVYAEARKKRIKMLKYCKLPFFSLSCIFDRFLLEFVSYFIHLTNVKKKVSITSFNLRNCPK